MKLTPEISQTEMNSVLRAAGTMLHHVQPKYRDKAILVAQVALEEDGPPSDDFPVVGEIVAAQYLQTLLPKNVDQTCALRSEDVHPNERKFKFGGSTLHPKINNLSLLQLRECEQIQGGDRSMQQEDAKANDSENDYEKPNSEAMEINTAKKKQQQQKMTTVQSLD
jgi:hypothetical protein